MGLVQVSNYINVQCKMIETILSLIQCPNAEDKTNAY